MGINPASFSDLGLALEHQGRLEEALASYNASLALKPDDFEVLNHRANVLAALGRIDDALASYDGALALNPDPETLYSRGSRLQELGRIGEALADYDRALALNPNYADVLVNRGNILSTMGRLDEALASYERALKAEPGYAEALLFRGDLLNKMNRPGEALVSYDRALMLNPGFVEALNNRAVVLKEMKRLDEALVSYDRALALNPDQVTVLNNRGHLLNELDRTGEALADYDRALALNPDDAEACNGRGNVMKKLDHVHEAEQMFRRAILLNPDSAEAYCNLGSILVDHGKSDQAEAVLRRAVALNPDFATALHNLGIALVRLDKADQAEAVIRRAVALNPDLAGAHHNLGVALMELGRLNEAREAAERAIALAPLQPSYFGQLGEVRRYVSGDRYVTALEALANNEASLCIDDQVHLHFALAKAHADVARPEDEFRRLMAGNALQRSRIDYDESAVLDQIDCTRQLFTAEFMWASRGVGEPSSKPIFIVGMPRSGTTLVEQILASHPRVFGAGELKLFERSMADIRSGLREQPAYPEMALQMSGQQFHDLGARYLAGAEQLAAAACHITDKMPSNFLFAGLIHLALPNAIIIHTVRDPVDTCISCFSKLFTESNFQTYDLAELGRYYRHYKALMSHWHRVLPPGRILEVSYEETVADVEGSARRILAHCGLPWDPRCLDFHRTKRVVRTASATQVRQPIYSSSIGRWRAYEPWLAPLLAELSPLLPAGELAAS
jgi:tetratricopeptide (TPR) repeat protein